MVSIITSICTFVVAFYVFVLCDSRSVVKEEENENLYVFGDEDFTTMWNSQEGHFKVLKKFTERTELFRGIENMRMLIFESSPHTFVIPSYWDSDILFFVGQGRGTITLVVDDGVESFNIEKGHLMTIPAGLNFYMINRDGNEPLILSGFVLPIANPGNFVPFFGVGGQYPESLYSAFSPEVLETFFNTSSDRLQKMFSQQTKGVIIRASKDQIDALSAEENTTHSPHGRSYCLDEHGPCQILDYCTESTEFGKIYMVFPTDYLKLQDLNMYISFSVTSPGCMNSPLYSTRVTKIIMVINGSGRFEMAAPHYKEGSTRVHYKKITAQLKRGMLFVVPPGYPLVLVASQDENLETLNLEFHAKGNYRYRLGGRNNIMKKYQKEAKELAFTMPAEDVDAILDRQPLDFFMRGPIQLQGRDIAGF